MPVIGSKRKSTNPDKNPFMGKNAKKKLRTYITNSDESQSPDDINRSDSQESRSVEESNPVLMEMNEFEREAELARRYDKLVRERQRQQLFQSETTDPNLLSSFNSNNAESNALNSTLSQIQQKKTDALSDIRARRSRRKLRQLLLKSTEKYNDESSILHVNSKIIEPTCEENNSIKSDLTISARTENREHQNLSFHSTEKDDSDSNLFFHEKKWARSIELPNGKSGSLVAIKSTNIDNIVRPAFDSENISDTLFNHDDIDSKRRKILEKALLQVTIEMMQSVRLSNDKIIHIMEHPKAETYLRGAYVKVPSITNETENISTKKSDSCIILKIGRIEECEEYSVNNRRCKYKLILCNAQNHRNDKIYVRDLIDSKITKDEFTTWKNSIIENRISGENIYAEVRRKISQLNEFAITDDDVQSILRNNEDGILRGASRVKLMKNIVHDIESLEMSLKNVDCDSNSKIIELQKKRLLDLQRKYEHLKNLAPKKSGNYDLPESSLKDNQNNKYNKLPKNEKIKDTPRKKNSLIGDGVNSDSLIKMRIVQPNSKHIGNVENPKRIKNFSYNTNHFDRYDLMPTSTPSLVNILSSKHQRASSKYDKISDVVYDILDHIGNTIDKISLIKRLIGHNDAFDREIHKPNVDKDLYDNDYFSILLDLINYRNNSKLVPKNNENGDLYEKCTAILSAKPRLREKLFTIGAVEIYRRSESFEKIKIDHTNTICSLNNLDVLSCLFTKDIVDVDKDNIMTLQEFQSLKDETT